METKSVNLLDQLLGELGNFSPGDRFHTVREIMCRFGVSQLVVDKAVSRLCSNGLLESVPRKGLFVPRNAVSRAELLPSYLIAAPNWPSPDIDEIRWELERLAARYPGRRLLLHRFDYRRAIPDELPIRLERVEGVVLMPGSINTMEAGDIAALNIFRSQIPVVVLCHHLDNFRVPSVGLDDRFAGNLAAHHLAGLGHRKLGILVSEPHSSVISDRVNGIRNYARLHEMSATVLDCGISSGETTMRGTYRTMEQAIRRGFDFTALIGVSASSIGEALNACLNYRVRIPEDLSVVAIGNASSTETLHPPVDTISTELPEQLDAALAMLGSGDTANRQIPPRLVKRISSRQMEN